MTYDLALVWLWAWANAATGLAYMLIPIEMWRWTRGRFDGLLLVAALFVAFILFCGWHHLRMPWTGHALHITEWDVAVDSAMAAVSVLAHVLLMASRTAIREGLALLRVPEIENCRRCPNLPVAP